MKTHISYDPTLKSLDITAPQHVEIQLRHDKQVLWVNVDGVCALRICRIESLKIEGFAPTDTQMVWVQNLISHIEGRVTFGDEWKAVFIKQLRALTPK